MHRVLIAGYGYVGSALAESLLQRGHDVYGLRRTPQDAGDGATMIAADLSRPLADDILPAAIDTVVYAASADERSLTAYRRAYVDGPLHLIDRLRRNQAALRRLVFLSSTGVFGHRDGRWVDESSPTASSGTGAVLEEGERTVSSAGLPAVVLRLGGIYGPGRRNLIDRVRQGLAGCPAGEPQYTNRMHRDDIVAAIEHLIEIPQPAPLYLGVDHEPADACSVVHWLAEALGAPEPPPVAATPGRPNKRCRNDLLVASGFTFRYPTFREGYRDVLAKAGLRPAPPPA